MRSFWYVTARGSPCSCNSWAMAYAIDQRLAMPRIRAVFPLRLKQSIGLYPRGLEGWCCRDYRSDLVSGQQGTQIFAARGSITMGSVYGGHTRRAEAPGRGGGGEFWGG